MLLGPVVDVLPNAKRKQKLPWRNVRLFLRPTLLFLPGNHAQLLRHPIPKSRPNPNFQKTLRNFDGEGGQPQLRTCMSP